MKSTNHAAVVVAAIVFFALGAAWYTLLAAPWAYLSLAAEGPLSRDSLHRWLQAKARR